MTRFLTALAVVAALALGGCKVDSDATSVQLAAAKKKTKPCWDGSYVMPHQQCPPEPPPPPPPPPPPTQTCPDGSVIPADQTCPTPPPPPPPTQTCPDGSVIPADQTCPVLPPPPPPPPTGGWDLAPLANPGYARATKDCTEDSPWDVKIAESADGLSATIVGIVYQRVTAGSVYPIFGLALSHKNEREWLLDLGGASAYIPESCLEGVKPL